MVFFAPVAQEWTRITEQDPAINIRTTFECSSYSVLWGFFASTSCEEGESTETSIGINVLSEAFCPGILSNPANGGTTARPEGSSRGGLGSPVPAIPRSGGGSAPSGGQP